MQKYADKSWISNIDFHLINVSFLIYWHLTYVLGPICNLHKCIWTMYMYIIYTFGGYMYNRCIFVNCSHYKQPYSHIYTFYIYFERVIFTKLCFYVFSICIFQTHFWAFSRPPNMWGEGVDWEGCWGGGEVNWKVRDEEGIWDVRGEGGWWVKQEYVINGQSM